MSCLKTIEYEITMEESFKVIRNCAGCGKKMYFINTKRFRVNANGNKLDVWLIYQCENCKHTWNLTIYERMRSCAVPGKEYERFLANDEALAEAYGRNFEFLRRNKAEVDLQNVKYQLEKGKEVSCSEGDAVLYVIHNPLGLRIRLERQVSEVVGVSGTMVKKMIEQGKIIIVERSVKILTFTVC